MRQADLKVGLYTLLVGSGFSLTYISARESQVS